MQLLGSIAAVALASATLCGTAHAQGSAPYDPSGWRPATEYEKKVRKTWEQAKEDGSSDRSIEARYDCLLSWAFFALDAREMNDTIPTIAGDLSHVFADGQLSHYIATLLAEEGGDVDRFMQRARAAGVRSENVMPRESDDAMIGYLGSCYVQPASWQIDPQEIWTGPEFMNLLAGTDFANTYPSYVRNAEARAEFDRLVLAKDFAGAANFAARLHANPALKSTVYWHEVLETSALAVANDRGLDLSDALLDTLSKVWWPKYRRAWASCALKLKRGGSCGNPRRNEWGSYLFEEPGWAKQERDLQRRNMLNYVPCNQWNRSGC